jgi:hypothetical protein
MTSFPRDHEITERGDGRFRLGVDGADFRGEAASHELGEHGALDEGGHAGHAFDAADFFRLGGPVVEDGFAAGHEMGVEAEDFAAQFLFEAGHDRDDKDQHHDAEGNAQNGNDCDEAEKRALRFQVAQGEKEAERLGHRWCKVRRLRAAGKDKRAIRAPVPGARGGRRSGCRVWLPIR